jgi:hypothetical protein
VRAINGKKFAQFLASKLKLIARALCALIVTTTNIKTFFVWIPMCFSSDLYALAWFIN